MDDFHLALRQEGGGYHHYLDGRAVHSGDQLELNIDGKWVLGRYEWSFHTETRPYLVVDSNTDDTITLSEHSLLRWPKQNMPASPSM